MTRKIIEGWGINDADYNISRTAIVGDRRITIWVCPYYQKWKDVIVKAHSLKFKLRNPTYINVTVCEEWKYFSNFRKWVDSQPNMDWMNCDLDKDILNVGNKHYSPETCVFVPRNINTFLTDSGRIRGKLMIGVCLKKGLKLNPYQAYCNTGIGGGSAHIGYYSTELEAHKAWQAKKHEYACMLAEKQQDTRVADALRQRYAPDKDWTNV